MTEEISLNFMEIKIIECANSFCNDCNNLMKELSIEFNFSLEKDDLFPIDIYNHKHNNKGIFKTVWQYYFHGKDCKFENLFTGQILEFMYIHKPEFGFINPFYFHNYMATTEKFKELADEIGSYKNIVNLLGNLEQKGIVERNDFEGNCNYFIEKSNI